MKDRPDDQARLLHMVDSIVEIENYLQGISFEEFCVDSKTKFATIKQLEIIGEAAAHLTPQLKKDNPEISWEQIIALRHILVHEYYGIQNEILWRIASVHIPEFRNQLKKII